MKKKALVSAGLILGFSASSVFAGGNVSGVKEYNGMLNRIEQVQRDATYRKLATLDIIENTTLALEKKHGKTNSPFIRNKDRRNKEKNSSKVTVKPHVNVRKKSIKERYIELKKLGKWNIQKPVNKNSAVFKNKNKNRVAGVILSKRDANIYRVIMNARNIEQLTKEQKMQVLNLHKRMLKTDTVKILLPTIQKGEGGKPLNIVGEGRGKSKQFKQIMANLNFSTHAAYQFPKGMRCFYHNKRVNKCSTASGCYQITKTNFDKYRKHFGLKDFSVETQQIIALELIRTGKAKIVPGNYKGRGYVEIIKGNVENAIRYGTNDWASSRFSEWGAGHKPDYIKISRTIAKSMKKQKREKLKDNAYYQNWLDEFEKDANS